MESASREQQQGLCDALEQACHAAISTFAEQPSGIHPPHATLHAYWHK